MSVKLLPKSKINELKQKERSIEIQEGVKLATRIDGLRELHSKTEEGLEKYKISTLTQIQGEIIALQTQKETLIGEIMAMRSNYDVMLPEISLKRTELADFEKKLMTWDKKLEKREEAASLLELDVMEALETAENSRIHAEDDERIARNLLIDAKNKKEESQRMVNEAKNLQTKSQNDALATEESLNLRELNIQTKEKNIVIKEVELMNKGKELDNEKIKVEDLRQTLERSLARLREGRKA